MIHYYYILFFSAPYLFILPDLVIYYLHNITNLLHIIISNHPIVLFHLDFIKIKFVPHLKTACYNLYATDFCRSLVIPPAGQTKWLPSSHEHWTYAHNNAETNALFRPLPGLPSSYWALPIHPRLLYAHNPCVQNLTSRMWICFSTVLYYTYIVQYPVSSFGA